MFLTLRGVFLFCSLPRPVSFLRAVVKFTFAYQPPKAVNVNQIVFKTTNFVCDSKYVDQYAKAATLYSQRDENVLRECFDYLREKASKATSDADLYNYCENAQ